MMLVAQGCIVADPPEYQAPGRTRPLLNVYGASPTATQALVVLTNPPVAHKFSIQVRSEDAGEELRAIFWLDYQFPGEDSLVGIKIPASTYDDPGRNIRFDWYPIPGKYSAGCHFLSLVVAHRNSFYLETQEDHLIPKEAEVDAAIVTWTVNLDPVGAENTLANCPSKAAP